MELFDAIKEAHIGKNRRLNVLTYDSLWYQGYQKSPIYIYDPLKDEAYQSYSRARRILSKHKIIENILKWIKVI